MDNLDNTGHMHTSNTTPTRNKARILLWVAVGVVICGIIIAAAAITRHLALNQESEATKSAAQVEISSDTFTPGTIRVEKGQSVVWTNEDESPHSIVIDNIDSDDTTEQINQGETYTYTFDAVGTYNYHDANDPLGIRGVIIVE